MKRHKPFRTALLVSVQERRELFPELTDKDVVTALRNVAGQLQATITRQYKAKDKAQWDKWFDEMRLRPKEYSEADVQRRQAEARQRAMQAQREWEQRVAERGEQQKVREEIIRAGYKALAKKHHPDTGGSTQQMTKLNHARDHLLSNT
jgi:hypothetical protein